MGLTVAELEKEYLRQLLIQGAYNTEIANARGSLVSLAERLNVALNIDGTLKQSLIVFDFITDTTLIYSSAPDGAWVILMGDVSSYYTEGRRVKFNGNEESLSYVQSAIYDVDMDYTVIYFMSTIGVPITSIAYSFKPSLMPAVSHDILQDVLKVEDGDDNVELKHLTNAQFRNLMAASSNIEVVNNVEALKALTPTDYSIVYIKGALIVDDGWHGFFIWYANSEQVEDDYNIVAIPDVTIGRWHRMLSGYVPTPEYSDSPGMIGQWSIDSAFMYICKAASTWDRFGIALEAWSNIKGNITSATIDTTGTLLTIIFTKLMLKGAAYQDADLNLDSSLGGTDIALTYVSGSGTDTWVFSIATVIRLGETVDLDYNGRPDGIEDASGNDLSAVASMTVVNGSTEDYSDIVLWDGFDGTITGSAYEATNYDYPAFHTAATTPACSLSTAIKKVGAKGLRINGGSFAFSGTMPPLSAYKGRLGLWLRLDTDIYGGYHTAISVQSASDTNQLMLGCVNSTQLYVSTSNNGVALIPATVFTPYYVISANVWFFCEVIWDFENVGLSVRINGDDDHIHVIPKIADAPIGYDRYKLGISGYYGYIDNLIISNDPNRDLYALALLEACPRV